MRDHSLSENLCDSPHAQGTVNESVGCVCTPIDLDARAARIPHRDHLISDIHYQDSGNTAFALQISIIAYCATSVPQNPVLPDGILGYLGGDNVATETSAARGRPKGKYNRRIPNNDHHELLARSFDRQICAR